MQQFTAAVQKLPGVAAVGEPVTSSDGHLVLIEVTSKTDPEGDATYALVAADPVRGPAALLQGANVNVGGAAAQDHDFTDLISGSMWKVALFVLLFSYLVLLLVMRSVVLPLKAIVMNLLSVGAAYGVLVIVFQYGWTDSLIGFDHIGYVNALTPPLILAIVFGLSMDYEVFLLSRIKERYNETHDNRAAVAGGLADSAKTITSAAVIMVLVFLIFAMAGLPQVKEIGVGLAVAIFLDATVVRLVLVPDHDGADGRLELVGAEVAGQDPAEHRLRVLGRAAPAARPGRPRARARGPLAEPYGASLAARERCAVTSRIALGREAGGTAGTGGCAGLAWRNDHPRGGGAPGKFPHRQHSGGTPPNAPTRTVDRGRFASNRGRT